MRFIKQLLLYLAMVLAAGVHAETVYKTVDEHGNVIFSDQPSAAAERIEIDKAPAVNFKKPVLPVSDLNRKEVKERYYSRLVIAQPANDETIRDNQGKVTVNIAVTPELLPAHKLHLELDGKEVATSQSTTIALDNVYRGSHEISVSIVDGDGKKIMTASPVGFHMKRTSKLHNRDNGQSSTVTPLNPPTVKPQVEPATVNNNQTTPTPFPQ